MSHADLAAFESLLGSHVIKVGSTYWRRIRPCFYRPLISFKTFDSSSIEYPKLAWLGGTQHAVPEEEASNSHLNFLMFENAPEYSADKLDYERRRQVRMAKKEFTIRPISDITEFKEKGYPIYTSFYQRTGYNVGSKRRNPAFFARWAEALFSLPNILILGGYRNGELGGVGVSFLVDGTVFYATFFCDNASLKLHLSGLMLHTVRERAAASPGLHKSSPVPSRATWG